MNKDNYLIFKKYNNGRAFGLLRETDSINSFVNYCLGNYYKELFLEYSHTKEDKPPKNKQNISISNSDKINLYEPNQTLATTTPDGEEIAIHGTEREMNIERAAMSETRALLIFLTYSRLDPIIRNYVAAAGARKEKDTSLNLTPEEQVEFEDLAQQATRVQRGNDFWRNKNNRIRYEELYRKKNANSGIEMIAKPEEIEKIKRLVTRRLIRLCGDNTLKEQIEDIVEFMFDFVSHNPDSVELLDLPKYKEAPESSAEPVPASDGHDHGGGGLGGVAVSAIVHALPDILQSAAHVLGFGGAALATAAVDGGVLLGKKIMGLIQNLKPSKALALMQGSSVRPTKERGWEINVNGKWEPIKVAS